MLPRKLRLPAHMIPSVRVSGKRTRTEYLDFYACEGQTRFAIITGSHIDKRATARNRMRRLVQEAIRLQGKLPPVDGVFVVRKKFPKQYVYENIASIIHSMV